MKPQAITNGHETGKPRRFNRFLRAANSNLRGTIALKAGPFLTASELKQPGGSGQALIMALLVIYPVLASVAVVIAGMYLLGSA